MFEYLKNRSEPNSNLFLQETYSRSNDNFNSQIHYSHGKSNLCGVFILFLLTFSDKHGRILILEALIDDTEFILINLYSANTKDDQLTTFSEPTSLIENFELT